MPPTPHREHPPLLWGLPPILPEGRMQALILGSFPSVASLESKQYYAHPQNWFWRVLEHCGVIESASAPYEERVRRLRRIGLGVWDLYGQVRREGSGDDRIHDAVANRIDLLHNARGPFPILLNGRRQREWNRHFKTAWRRRCSRSPAPAPAPSTGTPRNPAPPPWRSGAPRCRRRSIGERQNSVPRCRSVRIWVPSGSKRGIAEMRPRYVRLSSRRRSPGRASRPDRRHLGATGRRHRSVQDGHPRLPPSRP